MYKTQEHKYHKNEHIDYTYTIVEREMSHALTARGMGLGLNTRLSVG